MLPLVFVQVSADTMAGLQESTKAARIAKVLAWHSFIFVLYCFLVTLVFGMNEQVFEDAYKSPLSIVILDNIERSVVHIIFFVSYTYWFRNSSWIFITFVGCWNIQKLDHDFQTWSFKHYWYISTTFPKRFVS